MRYDEGSREGQWRKSDKPEDVQGNLILEEFRTMTSVATCYRGYFLLIKNN